VTNEELTTYRVTARLAHAPGGHAERVLVVQAETPLKAAKAALQRLGEDWRDARYTVERT
jgi:phage-related baseplate assembly protein